MWIIIEQESKDFNSIVMEKISQTQQTKENLPLEPEKTTVMVLGHFLSPNIINTHLPYPKISLMPSIKPYKRQMCPSEIYPRKIQAEGTMITLIDDNDNLWLVSGMFQYGQVNLSGFLKKRCKNIFLGDKECIVRCRKCDVLVNWGAKKIFSNEQLEELSLSSRAQDYFRAYLIKETPICKNTPPPEKDSFYYFTPMKKSDNNNRIYHILNKDSNNQIYGIPTLQKFTFPTKIVGVSIGKHHCLSWDEEGKLWAWGSKSIALGFEELPEQKVILEPKQVSLLSKKYITMAFAATHYSLALSSEGIIYEWGIKKQMNQLNQSLIFQPTELFVEEHGKIVKFIKLKGKGNKYGAISTSGKLYVWGEEMVKIIPKNIELPKFCFNNRIYEPFPLPYLDDDKVIDFCIENTYLAMIVTSFDSKLKIEEEKKYWNNMLDRVKLKMKIGKKIKTEVSEEPKANENFRNSATQSSNHRRILQNRRLCSTFRTKLTANSKSRVEAQYYEKSLKKQYFNMLSDEPNFFKFIMEPNNGQDMRSISSPKLLNIGTGRVPSIVNNNKTKFIHQCKTARLCKEMEKISKEEIIGEAQKFISDTTNENLKRKKSLNKFLMNKTLSQVQDSKRSPNKVSYSQRLKRVLQRKKSLDESQIDGMYKKMEENTLEYRIQKKEQVVKTKIFQKNRNALKSTLQSFLIRQYLISLFTFPIDESRNLKIEQFARNLKISKIEKNLMKIFIQYRVKQNLKKLRKINFHSYVLLCCVFRRFVARVRENKLIKCKKMVTESLYRSVIKQKIRFGISKTHLNARKLQKFRQWIMLTKIERLKCLKVLWRNSLLSVMKVKIESDSTNIFRPSENYSFETLYKEKVMNNPMLKLETFLNKTPIFQLRFQYFQSIIFLFKDKGMKKSESIKNIKKTKKKPRIKFTERTYQITYGTSYNQNDILPYSLHYKSLIRPSAMELNIPENMKISQKWIKEERAILQKFLNKIIFQHEKKFKKLRRQYDIKLAYFIKDKYESLSQKRWKCILEYNQLKQTAKKRKKQKELYRLFDLIGMTRTLDEDCLPEKYLMLEQGIKRRDAPTPPSPYIEFGMFEFKYKFKQYYEAILSKAKQLRKNYI